MSTVRIATRGSDLALWQARDVARQIEARLGARTEIVPVTTTGDRLRGSLAKVGGKGLFVKEIQEALLSGRADVAVHSAKDLPAELHPDLRLVAFPEPADPRDALCARDEGATLASLAPGSRVGTGSVRRAAQLRRLRPDLEVVPLRGNVGTRLAKVADELDAVVLACAGLDRLELSGRISERLSPESLLPAVGQGVVAVEARGGEALADDLAALDHPGTARRIAAERGFLAALGGDCSVPLAALARVEDGSVAVRGLLISPDGSRESASSREGPVEAAADLGAALAADVLARGGDEILAALRQSDPP